MPIIKRPPSPQYPNEDREPSLNNGRQPPRRTEPGGDGSPRRRSIGASITLWFAGLIATLCVVGALLVGYMLVVMGPQLPSLDALTNYQPKVPLRIYSADHVLIGEFGEERRQLVRFQDIPDIQKKAVLAIEDYRFYEHGAIDPIGIARAVATGIVSGHVRSGASTITQQVARNFFLSNEQTLAQAARDGPGLSHRT